jgi:adenosine deaminase CECR1
MAQLITCQLWAMMYGQVNVRLRSQGSVRNITQRANHSVGLLTINRQHQTALSLPNSATSSHVKMADTEIPTEVPGEVEDVNFVDDDDNIDDLADLGVPTLDEPFIAKYYDGRDALIAQEKRQRSDHVFRENLSPMAAEASAVVSAIRFQEMETLWNPQFEDNLAKTSEYEVHPGQMFSLAKERMESSKLWQIVRKMPKGALLHCHLEAMGNLDWLAEEMFSTEGICIAADEPLQSPEALETAPFLFRHVSKKSAEKQESIWSSKYLPNSSIPIAVAAADFSNGGKDGFIKWFKSRVTITPQESITHHMGPNAIWRKFTSTFSILASLQHYEPIFRKFIRIVLHALHEDGVRWVDMRSVFVIPFTRTGQDEPDEDYTYMLECLQVEIDAYKASDEGKGFWGARMIWTAIRRLEPRQIAESMQDCIAMKLEFPELICGFDLVGQEDLGASLAELTTLLFWFKKQCAQAGVDIPFFFHAGETLGDGTEVDENLFDAVLLGTRRIGHGFSLYKHPLLIDMVKDKKILVESCPVSNEVLRLTGSITSHPLPALLSRGVPCALCSDDPTVLGQGATGMSHDFYQALQGWENLGLEGLASLAENSVRWAAFTDCTAKEWQQEIKDGAYGKGVRAERMREWKSEWEKFCQWVVVEFGAETDRDFLD